jgi:thymidine phosphorylase
VSKVDAGFIGKACLLLGAGRSRADGVIDPLVGVSNLKKIGERVEAGEPFAVIHASGREALTAALPLVEKAFGWSVDKPEEPDLITEISPRKAIMKTGAVLK